MIIRNVKQSKFLAYKRKDMVQKGNELIYRGRICEEGGHHLEIKEEQRFF